MMPSVRDHELSAGELTRPQMAALDQLESFDPGAKVVGWHDGAHGPLIVRSNGSWQVLRSNGGFRPAA